MLTLLSYYKEILKKKIKSHHQLSNLGIQIQIQSLCQKIFKELEHSSSAEMAFALEGWLHFGPEGAPCQSVQQQKEQKDSNGIKEEAKQFLAKLLQNNYQILQ